MEQNANAIAALERVMLTVEAELTALHTGEAVNRAELETSLRTDLTSSPVAMQHTTAPAPAPAPAHPPVRPVPAPPVATRPTPRAMVPPPPNVPPPPQPVAPLPYPKSAPAARPARAFNLEQIFRLGGISLVVLAAVFFVSTAITRGWIGPHAQLTLAAVTSLAMIGQSFRFTPVQNAWRNTMAIGGSACLFVSGVVGHFGLDILNINVAMAWLGGTVLGFLALGRAHSSEAIAVSGAPAAVLGALLFTASGDANAAVMLGLGAIWALAVLAATFEQRWFSARAAGATASAIVITMGALIDPSDTMTRVGASIGVLSVLALVASQLREYTVTAREGQLPLVAQIEARLSATVTPWVVLIASILIHADLSFFDATESIGWFAIAAGVLVVAAATAAPGRIHPTLVMLHQLAGLGTAAVGLVAVLDGPALIAALLVQTLISAAFAYRTSSPEMIIGACVLGAVPSLWTLAMVSQGLVGDVLTIGEIVVTGATIATFAAVSFMLRRRPNVQNAWILGWGALLLWAAASLQGVPQTQMVISLVWAGSAIVLIATRRALWGSQTVAQARMVLNIALGTLLLTGAKLVFVDLVAVDVLWRAALFLLIGGTFLRLAFVLPSILDIETGNDLGEETAGEVSATEESISM